MSSFAPQPQPTTELGRYRLLSPSAGVRVSPICLGTMSLGQSWTPEMAGGTTQEEAFKFLDKYYEGGGNFIDTANNYQNGESETLVGAWVAARKNRDELVIATKYTFGYQHHRQDIKLKVNYQGNHRKSLILSVQDSLEKLQTSYIDILYVHWWDYSTSIPELMQALDSLVKSNKVLYLGISDTPAWLVVKANEYARAHGMAQFVVYQGLWCIGTRDLERDIVPMCRAEGMGIVPYGVLGQGKYKTEAEIKARTAVRYGMPQTEAEKKISAALEAVAGEVGNGATLVSVAVAWALAKAPYVFPVIGGRSPAQLDDVIKGLETALTPAQVQALEAAVPFVPGFPYNFFGADPALNDGRPNYMVNAAGWVKWVKAEAPIAPGS
ncbi:norsolorinic acid reductase [Trametes versicolor FP-101664 SS1]|uniref:norsolorinic acid reductase n=1 Tax=Trametes versicolor (strain FP-101664) TaxID=717944 RepID=UPI0004622FFF|nr:norsolorinic acid reductase [Trametes versicolor FP-101664 SS1]EIW58357.1 norsolorinic acid reductase [Trametes versicolor FP-101664 SS1]